jgi:hypothetical protein
MGLFTASTKAFSAKAAAIPNASVAVLGCGASERDDDLRSLKGETGREGSVELNPGKANRAATQ